MTKVKLSTTNPDFPLIRQTPNSIGIWGDCIYYINEDVDECDYWVIYDNLNNTEKTKCPKENVILITGEPPTVKNYGRSFIQQFNSVITCNRHLKHNYVTYLQQGLPWMAGAKFLKNENKWSSLNFMSYEYFLNDAIPKKDKEISIIISNKTFTTGHELRVQFVTKLKETFGDRIEIFGRGYNEIEDKFFALANYKYTIVLENSCFNDYWTEKIADAFLCEAYPIYYGCPNIHDYFPSGSLKTIDIENLEDAIDTINSVLENNEYEKSIELIKASKKLILNNYNLFALISNYIKNKELSGAKFKTKKTIKIYPEKRFQKKIKRFAKRLLIYCIHRISPNTKSK